MGLPSPTWYLARLRCNAIATEITGIANLSSCYQQLAEGQRLLVLSLASSMASGAKLASHWATGLS